MVKRIEVNTASDVVCVDLDGTLIRGDLMLESFIVLMKRRPLRALSVLFALLKGRAHLKRRIAREVAIDPAALPYREGLLQHLRQEWQRGVRLVLATGSDITHARAIADHLGIFSEVIATDGGTNMTGSCKAVALTDRFGERGFHYIGNDWPDVPVWRAAAGATVVGASQKLARHVAKQQPNRKVMDERQSRLIPLIRALRPHQWAKNVLVFVPAITSHNIFRPEFFRASVVTFVAFSLCASAIYIVNDILDINADRLHPRKRTRPFAAGDLSIQTGCVAAGALFVTSMALAALAVSRELAAVLVLYLAVTTAYSVVLKRMPVADVFTLTGLYVLRILAGGVATHTPLSSWLLAFALFLFLSLAFVKRYTELLATKGPMPGREYSADDALWMHAVGTSSGYMAVLVLALYVNAPEVAVLYTRPQVLWLLCPLFLFWLTRLWFRAGRQLVHDDPVLDALKDSFGYVVLVAASAVLLAAL
jgi:4-hydroxybenzoate polyprenyltransferase/phosphoserine phosphatase